MHVLKFNEAGGIPADDPSGGATPIYGSFFGLRERPFTLTPNPRFLYLSTRQREALSSLRYGLSTHNGFTLLTGTAGCGKTTLLRAALAELGDSKTRSVVISNPTLTRGEFYEYLARAFGLSEQAAFSKARFLGETPELPRIALRGRQSYRFGDRRSAKLTRRTSRGNTAPRKYRNHIRQAAQYRARGTARAAESTGR